MPQRLTRQTLRLLGVLVADPCHEWYGLELMERAGLSSGTIYPLLHRLEHDGWLASTREDVDPSRAGRPRRRLYRLTALGQTAASDALAGRPRAGGPSPDLSAGVIA